MKTLVEVLKEQARFSFARDGSLYYETESRFLVSIPVADMGTATFNATEKAINLMKWIRPQYAEAIEADKGRGG